MVCRCTLRQRPSTDAAGSRSCWRASAATRSRFASATTRRGSTSLARQPRVRSSISSARESRSSGASRSRRRKRRACSWTRRQPSCATGRSASASYLSAERRLRMRSSVATGCSRSASNHSSRSTSGNHRAATRASGSGGVSTRRSAPAYGCDRTSRPTRGSCSTQWQPGRGASAALPRARSSAPRR